VSLLKSISIFYYAVAVLSHEPHILARNAKPRYKLNCGGKI
jgi:hypothetical protein